MKLPQKRSEDIDLSAHLVEQCEVPESHEIAMQTDEFGPRPPSPPSRPAKTGVDASTQITEGDTLRYIFNYDIDVEPILEVIVSKTIEQALTELENEYELNVLKRRRNELEEEREEERLRVRWLEEQERTAWKRKQQKMIIEGERIERERVLREKEEALRVAREQTKRIVSEVTDQICREAARREATAQITGDFMPWLDARISERTHHVRDAQRVVDDLVHSTLSRMYMMFENRKCWIRVLVKQRRSEEEGDVEVPVGPIPVRPEHTTQDVVDALTELMMKDKTASAPRLQLLYMGRALSSDERVVDAAKDLDFLEVRDLSSSGE